MGKLRVAVVMGGPSAEYDISILSGAEVIAHLAASDQYLVRAVVVAKDRTFYATDVTGAVPTAGDLALQKGLKGPCSPSAASAIWNGVDVAFLALHGAYGEDGCFQGYLETIGIPYTGSGVYASSVAMNKIATKFLLLQNAIATPPFSLYGEHHPETTVDSIVAKHGIPCFVKCPQSGSSKLMGRADTVSGLSSLLEELAPESDHLIIETMVTGPEYTCPVIEHPDGRVEALPPIEIRPTGSAYFDYHAKYDDGGSQEICPAPVSPELDARIRETALAVHRIVGCSGVSRTDMILAGGTLQVLETNTLPGLTRASLLPKSFMVGGGTFFDMADLLIRTALAARRRDTP
jgi:D-alanine-D-alanine ligase